MNLRKWWKPALGIVALLITVQIGVSILVRTHRVHRYLAAHLESAFGRPVEVGQFEVQILPSPRLDIDGVTVGEDPAFGYEYFLRAEHLTASLRWMGLLRGHFEFGTLSLSRPSLILMRNREGRWNLERWLPPAKASAGMSVRAYGPAPVSAPANRLEKIEFDEGRVNFKLGDEKQPFAFTNVSGSVEQVSPGRWQLNLEAQPWRSGVALQSAGTMKVRGDIAGTSARLQPAEISVHWAEASMADLFRLLRGQDYGVRGVFALEGTAKIGTASEAQPGEWIFALQARAAQIHRWDLTERTDNPRVNVSMKGRWNVAAGSLSADQLTIEAPKSNLHGTARFAGGPAPGWEVVLDSAGIQAADLLAWYRAFHPDVAEGVSAQQFFKGAMKVRGWPLELEDAAFSSLGGEVQVPGLSQPLRIGSLRGGRERSKFVIEPVRISLDGEAPAAAAPAKSTARGAKRGAVAEKRNAVDLALLHDFEKQSGSVSIDGRADKTEDVLKVAAAFGRSLNHGWELTGGGSAALRWEWKKLPLGGQWNGKIEVGNARLQAVGLNQPLQIGAARLEWKEGKRSAQIGRMEGFGAAWMGEIAETNAAAEGGEIQWNFRLHADHLDATELDRWAGPRARPTWLEKLLPSVLGGKEQAPAASELLRRVNAQGELRVDEFTIEKLKLAQVRAAGSLRDLQVEVRDAEAQWAGGKVRAKMHAEFSPRPKYDVTAEFERINVAQMPEAARLAQRIGGLASGKVQLTTEGVGREELLKGLAGKGDVRLRSVEFRGWDVTASLRDGMPRAGMSRWSSGDGRFTLGDKSIVLESLQLTAGKERAEVRGNISFSRSVDLRIQTTIGGKWVNMAPGATSMLKLSGPLDAPSVAIESHIH